MKIAETDERAFEKHIEFALIGSTREEREEAGNTDVDAQHPASDKYYWGLPKDMDKKTAIDSRRLWSFLHSTQQSVLDEYKGPNMEVTVQKLIAKAIETAECFSRFAVSKSIATKFIVITPRSFFVTLYHDHLVR